ncbi:MAG: hypothetical protein ACTSQO_12800 [Candidatus Helarchaeota archaeon]
MSNEYNLDKLILKYQDKNPFPTNVITKKGTNLRVFIGRQVEMKEIGRVFKKISDERGICKVIIIEGESGVGKSTLFKRICDFIKVNDLKDLDLNNFKINIAWIEAPQDSSKFTFEYIYMYSIQGFSEPPADMGSDIIKRTVKYLHEGAIYYTFNSEERKFVDVLYSYFFHRKMTPTEFFKRDYDINATDFNFKKLIELIGTHKRTIRRYLKDFEIDYKYFLKFLKTAHPNNKISDEAKDDIEAEIVHDKNFLKSEEDFKAIFKNMINIYKWTYDEYNSVVVIAMDSFEQYRFEDFDRIFTFLLNIRNSDLKNFILFIIGTDQFWNDFKNFLEDKKSGYIQFQDLIGLDLKLEHLTFNETTEVIRKYLEYYYKEIGGTPSSNPFYPFNTNSIEYLYSSCGGNIRKILIKLRDVWEFYLKNNKVPKIQNKFQAMKNFRESSSIELSYAEIEILYNYFNDQSNFSTWGTRSSLVEQGVLNMLNFFKNHYPEIAEIHKNPEIIVSGRRVRPDIYFILFGNLGESEQKRIEIQVKMYEEKSPVKLEEASTSVDLLQNFKLEYLYFLTTSPLHLILKQRLKEFGQRVGGFNPLNKEQIAYLTLILPNHFDQIFKREITLDDYQYLFQKIFNFSFDFFLDYMRLIPKNTGIRTLEVIIPETSINELRSKFETIQVSIPQDLSVNELVKSKTVPIETTQPPKIPAQNDQLLPPKPIELSSIDSQSSITTYLKSTSPAIDDILTPSTTQTYNSEPTPNTNPTLKHENLETIIPQNLKNVVISTLIKMANRTGRYKNRATLAWLKKELADDFTQDKIGNGFKWLKNSNLINFEKTSIYLNENSKILIDKYKSLVK